MPEFSIDPQSFRRTELLPRILLNRDLHGLLAPVSQRTPDPLHRSEAKTAQPDRARDQQEQPYGKDHVKQLIPLQFCKQSKAIALEDRRADQARRQITGQSHLSDRGQSGSQPLQPAGFDDQHDQADMAARDQQPAGYTPEDPCKTFFSEIEAATREIISSNRIDGSAYAVTEYDHQEIKLSVPLGCEDPQLEQRHPDQHHSGRIKNHERHEGEKQDGLSYQDFFYPPFE